MRTDTTAQLTEIALQADSRAREDAVLACRRYCGSKATPPQARRFVDEQIRMLEAFDDRLSRELLSGWEWLAGELELAALEAAEAAPATPQARRKRTSRRRRRSFGLRSDAPSEA